MVNIPDYLSDFGVKVGTSCNWSSSVLFEHIEGLSLKYIISHLLKICKVKLFLYLRYLQGLFCL